MRTLEVSQLPKTIKARYRNGIVEPLEEVNLTDGAEITVTLEDYPADFRRLRIADGRTIS